VRLVVNPRCGDGRASGLGQRLAAHLRTNRYDVQVLETDDLLWARHEIVRTGSGLGCLIGVGGDHTLNEMAAAAAELQVPLLPVPAGFGNILARNLGYEATMASVLDLLETGDVRWIDAGRVGCALFLANQTFGFIRIVQLAVETTRAPSGQRLRRYLEYWRAAARTIARVPLPALWVEIDGRRLADAASMVMVANVPTFRGFLTMTPEASPFDGLLDVVVVPAMPKPRLLALLFAFLVHAPGRWRAVRCRRAAHVRVGALGVERELSVMPAAVPMLLPRRERRAPRAAPADRVGMRLAG
jgi:diacylglycerol kinase (ATP)